MDNEIKSKKDFVNSLEQLKTFCAQSDIKFEDFISAAQLFNRLTEFSTNHAIPLDLSPDREKQLVRTALIADIHGNADALELALKDIETQRCDRIICLGDVVDGGDGDEQAVAELIKRNITTIRGNHDEWPPMAMDMELQNYLKLLPPQIIEEDIIFTHISPREKELPVANTFEAWNVFDETAWKIMFIGHLHYPIIFGAESESSCTATCYDFDYNTPFQLNRSDRYIICPGPVGYSRDSINEIRYAIFDSQEYTVEIRKLEGPLLDVGNLSRF